MRAFIAIHIPAHIRKKICEFEALMPGSIAKTSESNLHITLQFLGDIDEKAQTQIVQALKSIDERPFSVGIAGISSFGKGSDTHIVYANVKNGGKIKEIYLFIKDSLSSKGLTFKHEKEYAPHVTIARPKGANPAIQEFISGNKDKEFGTFEVNKISLDKSTLSSLGPVYETLYERELL